MQNNGRFINTVLVSSIGDFSRVKVGQWVQTETGSRGQYLGKTEAGVTVIRWQQGKFCSVNKSDVFNNKWLRLFAKGAHYDRKASK